MKMDRHGHCTTFKHYKNFSHWNSVQDSQLETIIQVCEEQFTSGLVWMSSYIGEANWHTVGFFP